MRKIKIIYIIIWVVLCVQFSGCSRQEELILIQSSEVEDTYEDCEETALPRQIAVYVCGQVVCPGVVYLGEDARAVDAVEAAGGLTEDADEDYINLAARLSDGEKLYIPGVQEAQELRAQEIKSSSGLVNINTADSAQLMTLPGIGESKARDIIAYREKHGEFTEIEELMKVSGIKESLFEKVKERISVE